MEHEHEERTAVMVPWVHWPAQGQRPPPPFLCGLRCDCAAASHRRSSRGVWVTLKCGQERGTQGGSSRCW
eukprot:3560970-Rhodomonas_salina.1